MALILSVMAITWLAHAAAQVMVQGKYHSDLSGLRATDDASHQVHHLPDFDNDELIKLDRPDPPLLPPTTPTAAVISMLLGQERS